MPISDSERTHDRTAPYLPFATFLTALDRLSPDPPHVLDKRIFNSFSGAVQSQIFGAFRFLGLIDQSDRVQSNLERLVKASEEERKQWLHEIIQEAYPEAFQSSLLKATPRQLESVFEQNYHVWGDTCRKAVTYFVKAAQYSGIALSTFLTSRKGRSAKKKNGNRKTPLRPDSDSGSGGFQGVTATATTQNTTKVLKLATGDAEIGLTVKFDPFTISEFDRKFIFAFIDKMNAYTQPSERAAKDDDNPFGGMGITDDDGALRAPAPGFCC